MPVLGLPTFFVDAMRYVDCPCWGRAKMERVPWSDGKQRSSKTQLPCSGTWQNSVRRTSSRARSGSNAETIEAAEQ